MFSPGNLRATFDNPEYEKLISYWVGEKYTLRYTGGMVPDVFQVSPLHCLSLSMDRMGRGFSPHPCTDLACKSETAALLHALYPGLHNQPWSLQL